MEIGSFAAKKNGDVVSANVEVFVVEGLVDITNELQKG